MAPFFFFLGELEHLKHLLVADLINFPYLKSTSHWQLCVSIFLQCSQKRQKSEKIENNFYNPITPLF